MSKRQQSKRQQHDQRSSLTLDAMRVYAREQLANYQALLDVLDRLSDDARPIDHAVARRVSATRTPRRSLTTIRDFIAAALDEMRFGTQPELLAWMRAHGWQTRSKLPGGVLSAELAKLTHDGLLRATKSGRWNIYRLAGGTKRGRDKLAQATTMLHKRDAVTKNANRAATQLKETVQ